MKNDIKQIKNELTNTQTQKQAKEQKKAHQERLKDNLSDLFIEALEYKEQTLLYILENKHDFIIKAIKMTVNGEQLQNDDSDFKKFDEQYHTKKYALKEKETEEKEVEDYNYLYDIFFSVYSKFEREEKKKEKLQKEENERKLHKIITNKMEFILETAKNQTGEAKKRLVLTFKLLEIKAKIISEIKEIFKEFSTEDISKMYDTVLKELLNKYKYTSESEPEQSKPVRLHWVWKVNIALDTINTLFKHF